MRARKGRQTPVGGVGQGTAAVGRRNVRARAGGQPEAVWCPLGPEIYRATKEPEAVSGVATAPVGQSRLRSAGFAELRGALDAAAVEGTGLFLTEKGVRLIREALRAFRG